MVVLGLLLVVVAIIAVVAAVLRGGDPTQVDLQWFTAKTDITGVFLAGAVTSLIGVLGLGLIVAGLKRNRRKRAEMNTLKARAEDKDSRRFRASRRSRRSEQTESTDASSSASGERRQADDREPPDEDVESTPRER